MTQQRLSQRRSPQAFGPFERMLAMRYLRAKRKHGGVTLISMIAYAGVAMAVAVLIIVMSVMNGFRVEFFQRLFGFNAHVNLLVDAVPASDLAAITASARATSGVTEAVAVVEDQALAAGPEHSWGVMVRGISREDIERTPLIRDNIKLGTLAGFGEGEDGGDTVLIGYALAARLGISVGSEITIVTHKGAVTPFGITPRRKAYLVGGVFEAGHRLFDESYVMMPLQQAQLFFGRGEAVDRIDVRIQDPYQSVAAMERLRNAIGAQVPITDWQEQNREFVNALKIERNMMRLILFLIVMIAALNILSGLVMLAKNKSRDVAILRTMGATQGAILRVFFLAGASIGVAGTLTGVVVGLLFCLYIGPIQDAIAAVTGAVLFDPSVYFLSRIPASVDWLEVSVIAASALAVSFLATLPPAWRAARLDPVEALRYE